MITPSLVGRDVAQQVCAWLAAADWARACCSTDGARHAMMWASCVLWSHCDHHAGRAPLQRVVMKLLDMDVLWLASVDRARMCCLTDWPRQACWWGNTERGGATMLLDKRILSWLRSIGVACVV